MFLIGRKIKVKKVRTRSSRYRAKLKAKQSRRFDRLMQR